MPELESGFLSIWSPTGVGKIKAGLDLADEFIGILDTHRKSIADGDIVMVTSKVVSKAEGMARATTRDAELTSQTTRVVARRGATQIVRNLLGLTMAGAGIDASNVEAGTILLLPTDPDRTARQIRATLAARLGVNVGVIITDTSGRAWRHGQTDIAIGTAGVVALESFNGATDSYGNQLAVTLPAVADELAGAAELAQGKLGGRPFAVISGRPDLVLPAGEDGAGAAELIRSEVDDLFGFGAREAVVRALKGAVEDRAPFGAIATSAEMLQALTELEIAAEPTPPHATSTGPEITTGPVPIERLTALTFAFGWEVLRHDPAGAMIQPATP